MTHPPPNRRTFALLVLGAVAFTYYGSLVPFDYRPRPWGEVVDSFAWAMRNRALPESRSDGVANVLLGIPLGFALLGLVCVDRTTPVYRFALVRAVLLLPLCTLVAAGAEFAQLYFPARTCSGSDVLCQTLGAALGMAAWVVAGQRLTAEARAVWGGSRIGGAAGRLLAGYLALLAFVQTLPLDLTLSPGQVGGKLRDQAVSVPFGEFHGHTGREFWGAVAKRLGKHEGTPQPPDADPDRPWKPVAKLLTVFGLYLPVGLLLAKLPGRRWGRIAWVAAAAVALGCVLEALQLIVVSRTPSATDVTVGAAGVLAGWGIGRASPFTVSRASLLGVSWFAALAVVSWQPFRFAARPVPFDWVPGLPLEGGNPLFALEEMLTKLVLFSLGGVMIGALGGGRIAGALAGLVASAIFEAGQTAFALHTPCVTDVLLGGCGAFVGAWLTTRLSFAS